MNDQDYLGHVRPRNYVVTPDQPREQPPAHTAEMVAARTTERHFYDLRTMETAYIWSYLNFRYRAVYSGMDHPDSKARWLQTERPKARALLLHMANGEAK